MFFYISIIISKITTNFTSSPNCSPRHNILKHASAVYAKHRQVLTPKQPFCENFPWKIVLPQFCVVFWHQKLQETPKGLHEFFWQTKSFRDFFCDTPSTIYQNFCTGRMGSTRSTRNFKKYQKGFFIYFSVLLDKMFTTFFGEPFCGLPRRSRRTDEQRRLWRIHSFF